MADLASFTDDTQSSPQQTLPLGYCFWEKMHILFTIDYRQIVSIPENRLTYDCQSKLTMYRGVSVMFGFTSWLLLTIAAGVTLNTQKLPSSSTQLVAKGLASTTLIILAIIAAWGTIIPIRYFFHNFSGVHVDIKTRSDSKPIIRYVFYALRGLSFLFLLIAGGLIAIPFWGAILCVCGAILCEAVRIVFCRFVKGKIGT